MEVTGFPFLTQEEEEEEEISDLYSVFSNNNHNNNNEWLEYPISLSDSSCVKRKRCEESKKKNENEMKKHKICNESGSSKKGKKESVMMRELVASLIMLEEEERREEEVSRLDFEHQKLGFDAIDKTMNDYLAGLDTHYSEMEELGRSRNKRARPAATAAVVGAAAGSMVVESGQGQPQQRRMWVKDRSKDWWDRCNHPDFPEEEFKKAFRMSKSTFDMICRDLDSAVMKKNTMLREAIPVRQRVAVCIWRLATGEPLRLVSKRFGLGISTCHKLVLEVCAAIRNVLMPKFVQWPEEERMRMIKSEFHLVSHIPNVGGAMYTTHVPIIAPKIRVAEYFNKRHTERNHKTSYSITVQGVVDNNGAFTDICIGWPGSMTDDQVLHMSALYHQRAAGGHLKDVWILGNRGLPLTDWLLVPYTHHNLTWTQHAFNEKVGEVQTVAKNAFMRLKGRWTCLQKRTEVKLTDLPVVLGACCVLHNICEMRNEEMDPELNFDLFDDEIVPENSLRSVQAIQARDHIAHNLLHHGLAGTSFL